MGQLMQTMDGLIADRLIADWKRMRATLVQQLELLESGKMGAGDRVSGSRTAETIARVKRAIAELEAMIDGRNP